jgi:Type IIA topoisomerase (DNA gyrase/topo II, topoisomerase IV), A subunit
MDLTPQQPYKLVKIASIRPIGKIPNYDITVDTVHEFYAEGISVKNCMGSYHPHGDSSIYGALVNIVNLPQPLFTGHGNWGSLDGDEAAASRYTECRLSKFADDYLLDPNYMAVIPTTDNYDGTCTEPVYLPSKLPNVLITGAEGIAMGCTTLIPTYSKDSVTELVKQVLKSKKLTCTPKMCYDTLEFKFTGGGLEYNDEEDLMEYYKTGEGKLHFVPEVRITDKNKINITSLSPRLKPSKIYDTAADIDGIKDCKNIHGKNCPDWAELTPSNKSLSKKQLTALMEEVQETYITALSCKTLVTERHDDGTTVTFRRTTIPNIVTDWVKWRIDFEIKVVDRLIKLEQTKMQRLKWLIWAIDHLELVFKALKTKDPDAYLVKHGKISEEHAKYILDQQTRRLSKLSGEELHNKVIECKKYISSLKSQIDNKNNVAKRIYSSL